MIGDLIVEVGHTGIAKDTILGRIHENVDHSSTSPNISSI